MILQECCCTVEAQIQARVTIPLDRVSQAASTCPTAIVLATNTFACPWVVRQVTPRDSGVDAGGEPPTRRNSPAAIAASTWSMSQSKPPGPDTTRTCPPASWRPACTSCQSHSQIVAKKQMPESAHPMLCSHRSALAFTTGPELVLQSARGVSDALLLAS